MDKKQLKNPIHLSFARTIIKHVLAIFAYATVRYIFFLYTKDLKFTPPERTIWETLMFLAAYFSASYAFNVYNKREYLVYISKKTHPPLLFELWSCEFIFDFICLMILMLFTPFNIAYELAVPVTVIINVLTFLLPRKSWLKGKGAATKSFTSFRLAAVIFFTTLEYCIAFLLLAGLIPVLAMYLQVIFLLMPLFKYVYIAIFIIVSLVFLSALKKRRKFMKRLKKFCKQHNYSLSNIHRPYLSVFYISSKPNFTIGANNKQYDVKLISFANKLRPAIFKNDGFFYRTSARNIKYGISPTITTERSYSFESDNPKIVVLTSIPYMILISEFGKTQILDAGDSCGEYKVFNPDGFFGAVERGTIDRKTFR